MGADWNQYMKEAAKRRNAIRALYDGGKSIAYLASKFRVSQPRIHQIINGKSRKPAKRNG